MLGGARLEVDVATPSLAQCVSGRVNQAGQCLDALQLAKRRLRQYGLDRLPKGIVIDGLCQAASQPYCELLKTHDLPAVTMLARCAEAKLTHCHATMNYYRLALQVLSLPAKSRPIMSVPSLPKTYTSQSFIRGAPHSNSCCTFDILILTSTGTIPPASAELKSHGLCLPPLG